MALALKNPHERDAGIRFDEPTHTYWIHGSCTGVISVTKFLHCFFSEFDADKVIQNMKNSPKWPESKYFGMEDEAIKKQWKDNGAVASKAGTATHLAIENYLNSTVGNSIVLPEPSMVTSPEWSYFQQFWAKMSPDLEPYRLEWPVWIAELKLAGSIDAVFRRPSDGAFFIYDWKRTKELKMENRFEKGLGPLSHVDDCNYWHYTLQLNVYAWILEKHYGIPISGLYLVILHPDNTTYERKRLNRMDDEVNEMLKARLDAIRQKSRKPVVL